MYSDDPQKNASHLVISPFCQESQAEIIAALDDDVRSLNKIQSHLRLCHAYIDQFRGEVSDYLPFLTYDVITNLALLKFCVRMRKCTKLFLSAMILMEEQFKFCGLKLPEKDEISAFISSFYQGHERLTLFFQTVQHFFSPSAPYLKENAEISELLKENPWEDVGTHQYNFSQMCQIIQSLHIEYILLRRKFQVLITIFVKLFPIFHCKERYILIPVYEGFKDIHCEVNGLVIFLAAVGQFIDQFKEMQQSKLKSQQKHQKAALKQLVKNPLKEGGEKAKQVVREKVKAQQCATKAFYLTIKQKAYGIMRTFFGRPSAVLKGKKQQQPQQAQCLLKEQ